MEVTGRITSVLHKIFVILHLLGLPPGKITFALLGNDIGNESLLAFEVITHCLRFIFPALIFEYRAALHFSHTVGTTYGINDTTIHVHGYFICLELYILVFHHAVSIHISRISTCKYDGIFCRIIDYGIQRIFLFWRNTVYP